MKRPRLAAVESLPNYQLQMTFINGSIMTVNKGETIFAKPGLTLILLT